MHRHIARTCGAALLVLGMSPPVLGQNAAPAANAAVILPPLKIVVTVSRYDGEKKLSSLPYTMSVIPYSNTGDSGRARLRMGTQVPVPSTTTAKDGGPPTTSYIYRDVGTNIDVSVRASNDSGFKVDVNFEDSSVFSEPRTSPAAVGQITAPSIRNFSISNQVLLKDGQSAQFNTSPDKVNGEVVKLDISLTVIK